MHFCSIRRANSFKEIQQFLSDKPIGRGCNTVLDRAVHVESLKVEIPLSDEIFIVFFYLQQCVLNFGSSRRSSTTEFFLKVLSYAARGTTSLICT